MNNTPLVSILLVAGSSRRFGTDNKLLAKIDGTPICAYALTTLLNSSTDKILVVTGYQHESVQATLIEYCDLANSLHRVQFVQNPLFKTGMGSSIATGIRSIDDAGAVIICLADMPDVSSDVINTLHSAWRNNSRYDAIVPEFNGQRGNPVLLAQSMFTRLLKLQGDTGARHILEDKEISVLTMPVNTQAVVSDIDVQNDLPKPLQDQTGPH